MISEINHVPFINVTFTFPELALLKVTNDYMYVMNQHNGNLTDTG